MPFNRAKDVFEPRERTQTYVTAEQKLILRESMAFSAA